MAGAAYLQPGLHRYGSAGRDGYPDDVIRIQTESRSKSRGEVCYPSGRSIRTPIDRARISRATIRWIFDASERAAQKFPRGLGIIPTAREVELLRVKSPAKSACSGWRCRKKQVCIFWISKISLGEKSKVFICSHAEIVRPSKRGHFTFHSKKNFFRLRG
jgi:hypothetical protein